MELTELGLHFSVVWTRAGAVVSTKYIVRTDKA
jgi:hypothetical protein